MERKKRKVVSKTQEECLLVQAQGRAPLAPVSPRAFVCWLFLASLCNCVCVYVCDSSFLCVKDDGTHSTFSKLLSRQNHFTDILHPVPNLLLSLLPLTHSLTTPFYFLPEIHNNMYYNYVNISGHYQKYHIN